MGKIYQNKGVGENIKAMRRNLDMKQVDVVVALEDYGVIISRSSYTKIELGSRSIKVSELKALSKIFNCDYNAFFKGI